MKYLKLSLITIFFIIPFSVLAQITSYDVSAVNARKYDSDLQAYSDWEGWQDISEGSIKILLSSTGVKLKLFDQVVTFKFTEDISSAEWPLDKKAKAFGKDQSESGGDGEFYGKTTLQDLLAGKCKGQKVYFWLSIPGVKTTLAVILE